MKIRYRPLVRLGWRCLESVWLPEIRVPRNPHVLDYFRRHAKRFFTHAPSASIVVHAVHREPLRFTPPPSLSPPDAYSRAVEVHGQPTRETARPIDATLPAILDGLEALRASLARTATAGQLAQLAEISRAVETVRADLRGWTGEDSFTVAVIVDGMP